MSKHNRLPVYYLALFIVMIIINFIAGGNVSEVANKYDTLIQPAGYAFSIWGLIYLGLFAWIIRMLVVKNSRDKIQISIQWIPALNFVLNSIWIIVFTQEWLFTSVLVILTLWLTVIWMYVEVNRHYDYHWLDRLPLSLYLGWVSLAMVVNVFTWFDQMGVTFNAPFDETLVTTLTLGVVAIIIVLFTIKTRDWIIPLVGLWTYIAIIAHGDVADAADTAFYVVIFASNFIFAIAAFSNAFVSKERYLEYRKSLF
ncbi:tryptophan-rich sensory protein [Aliicoccus persicus]|uniref:TspO and MBR related proteins n=1 Tax=Aliicoccus persicus TaxID=930138 RepID=A0A662Z5Y8_9STAP|nr:tryptophan-rich sensory protein [Aliicoccus persicus]SEV94474.1 TspO and MBR related proteins [Aliicoccus persicus]